MKARRLASRSVLAHVAERDRVAELGYGWDAVFPLLARRTAQEVGRARVGDDVDALPRAAAGRAPESEHTRRQERQPDDLAEYGLVTVPPDRRTGAVLRDEHMLEGL